MYWFVFLIVLLASCYIYDYDEEGNVFIVHETNYHAALFEFKDILYFYHNANLSESKEFRRDFIYNSSKLRAVNNTIKLAVFDVNVSMKTAEKLDLIYYPTVRLFMNKTFYADSNSSSKAYIYI